MILIFALAAASAHASVCGTPSGDKTVQPRWRVDHYVYDASLKRAAEEARSWLDLIYLVECQRNTPVNEIPAQIAELRAQTGSEQMIIVIDDCQRLGAADQPLDARIAIITEQLQEIAMSINTPIFAVFPNLETSNVTAQTWGEKIASPDVILVL